MNEANKLLHIHIIVFHTNKNAKNNYCSIKRNFAVDPFDRISFAS